ncbi:MAG: diguanylate cyclase with integral rane sensor [Firmicutes bacterium]|nr:diguanylate cyclase with integral rane sensor [Bacillota bacterium]
MRLLHKFAILFSALVILSNLSQLVIEDKFFFKYTDEWMLSINHNSAVHFGELLSGYFRKVENLLRIIALDPENRNNQVLIDKFREMDPEIHVILILNKQGDVILSSGDRNVSGLNFFKRDYFQHAINGEIYISGTYISVSGEQVVAIARPIIDNDTIQGVIVGIIQLHANTLDSIFDSKSLGREGYIAIVDGKGTVVYHEDKERIGKQGGLFSKLQGLTGSGVMKNYYGVESYIGYSTVAECNWMVIVSTPLSELITIRKIMLYKSITVTVLMLFLLIAVGTYIIRRYTAPIDKLIEAFDLLKKGNYQKIAPYDYAAEFGEMIRVYNDTVTMLESVNTDLKVEADHDALTGAHNRRSFDKVIDLLESEIKDGLLERLGVIMIDLDFFKQLNDKQGHLAGDNVLKRFTTIAQSIAGSRTVFRFGGDEFAILVRNISSEETYTLAEAIRLKSERELEGCTVSIGFASYPRNVDSIESLIELADKALYISKISKNRVTEYIRPM